MLKERLFQGRLVEVSRVFVLHTFMVLKILIAIRTQTLDF